MTSPDSVKNQSWLSHPANFTRHSTDLVAKFKRQHRWHLIPLYHLLRLSDFGREGIERSGSYRFADHLYCNEPSGRGWMGRALDRILLHMPAARAMRQRYFEAANTMEKWLDANEGAMRVLAVPCGIPRDVTRLLQRRPEFMSRIDYVGMDVDAEVLEAAEQHLRAVPGLQSQLLHGDALQGDTYPDGEFDVVVSTGLGEFLDDEALAIFYSNVFDCLRPSGVFYTSATTKEKRSDYLLRAFELETSYRDLPKMEEMMSGLPWRKLEWWQEVSRLQTFVRAIR